MSLPSVKPTHVLKALNKATNWRTEVGCGWLNNDGSISVRLNPCVVLSDQPGIVFTLFPKDLSFEQNANANRELSQITPNTNLAKPPMPRQAKTRVLEDDVPF